MDDPSGASVILKSSTSGANREPSALRGTPEFVKSARYFIEHRLRIRPVISTFAKDSHIRISELDAQAGHNISHRQLDPTDSVRVGGSLRAHQSIASSIALSEMGTHRQLSSYCLSIIPRRMGPDPWTHDTSFSGESVPPIKRPPPR